ncbi:uncharacterized protein LOC135226496 [Macrobrachium nipponense]|uniref:uncharacterized protein LOC135226496 n=1 Tax=Macrobrachium nipponense TaxID=159736 RepID=UPI0030C7DF74
MAEGIPVVDMGKLGLGSGDSPGEQERQTVANEIAEAFRNVGFVYLKNHGIPKQVIEEIFTSSKEFFSLDQEVKAQYNRGVTDIQGYTEVNRERLTTGRDAKELRESYDIRGVDGMFPEEVPFLKSSASRIIQYCVDLSRRLLSLMEIALGLDRNYFGSLHQRMFGENNATCLRLLHYPPLSGKDYKEGLIRCGQHTDYGTFTLLFQDSMGGLEVLNRAGKWLHADPIPDAILVNIGDLMQFWTNDEFVATEHRVLVPKEEIRQRCARQSVVCFVHPDDEVLIKPLNNSSMYTPVTSKEHTDRRFHETYVY